MVNATSILGVDDVSGILAHANNAVLVKYHLPGHPAPVTETVMAGSHQICRRKGPALALSVFVSGMGKQEGGYMHRRPASFHILERGLTEVYLHLLPHGKLRHGLIASWIRMPGKAVFLPEFFHIPGHRSLSVSFFVMLFQPVTDLGCCQRRILPEPGNDLSRRESRLRMRTIFRALCSYSSTSISQYRFTVLRLIPKAFAAARWEKPASRI